MPAKSQADFSEPAGSSAGTPSSAIKSTPRKRSSRGAGESTHKRVCSETAIPESKLSERASSLGQKAPASKEKEKARIYRNQAMRESAKHYDSYRCVVTGSADPHCCHIIPFLWNSTLEHLQIAISLEGVMSYFFRPDDPMLLGILSSRLGASDETWNIICLSPQLNTWWRHAYFGLKYLGHEDNKETGMSTAELQFVWMPHSHYDKSKKRIDLNEEKHKASNIRACLKHMFGAANPPARLTATAVQLLAKSKHTKCESTIRSSQDTFSQ